MRTIEEINREIKEIRDNVKSAQKTTSAQKSRVEFLKQMKSYLETNPKEEFVRSESERIKNLIDSKSSQYEIWLQTTINKGGKLRDTFETEMGIPSLRQQLKTLNWILK
jgi:hypothetical protein